ncbi:MAG: S8 family serine peptidase, partial [Opitutaceae bacterium]
MRGAVVLEQREIRGDGGVVVERWRLVELKGDPGRLARVVDHLEPAPDANTGRPRVAQEIMAADSVVVGVPAGSGADEVVRRLRSAGFETRAAREGDAVVVVQLPEATLDAVPDALRALAAALPDVTVEPNFLQFPFQATPSDYHAAEMWGLENIEAPAAWTVSTGSASVVVAVIDTGIDLTHPDLVSNIWINAAEMPGNGIDDDGNGFIDDVSGWNFAEGNTTAADADDHGTHVSGIIGAIGGNDAGIAGINWSVRIIPLRVGNRTFESGNTLNALRYVNTMRERGVKIVAVNASFGGGAFSMLFRDELAKARDHGVLFVAAAGNDNADNDATPVYPANYDLENIISVAAIRPGNELSAFSNRGASTVDLAAPGTGIRSTVRGGGYEFFNGTSMAAPHVAGAAALIAAVNPGMEPEAIRGRILASVDVIPALTNLVATDGKLNLRRAVAPSLVPPSVSITTPAAGMVLMDRPGVPLELTATLAEENGVSASASIVWETAEGPAPAAFSDADQLSTTVSFPEAGRYAIRVVATSGAFVRSACLVVAVGAEGIGPPAAGLVAWWNFNDTGSTARDSSGLGRNGTFSGGGPARVPGIERGGVRFDGANGRIAFSAPMLSSLSIAAWIDPAASGGASIFPRVVQMQSGLLFLGRDASAAPDDGKFNTLKFARDTGTDARVWFAPPGTAGGAGWSHVAATFDTSGGEAATPRLYFEGRPQVVGTQSSAPTTPAVSPTTGYIGDRGDGGRPWNGAIDELRIYDRVLTRAEIAVLAHGPRLRALLAGHLSADLSHGTLSVPAAFSFSDEPGSPPALAGLEWSALEGGAQSVPAGPRAATVSFSTGGAHTLRLDMVADGVVHVVRTLPMQLNTSAVNPAGRYT